MVDQYVTLCSSNRLFPQNTAQRFTCPINIQLPEGTKISLVGLKTPTPFNITNSSIIVIDNNDRATEYKLNDGLYPTINSLNKLIKKDTGGSIILKLKQDRCYIVLKNDVKKITLKGSLPTALGFHSDGPLDLDNMIADDIFPDACIKSLFLECNFITSEQVDQSSRQILSCAFTTNNTYSDNIQADYKKLTRLNLDYITFNIVDFAGDNIPFSLGTTILRLHFFLGL